MYKTKIILSCVLCLWLTACGKDHRTPVDIFYTADVQGVAWPRVEPRFDNKEVGGYGVLKNFLDRQAATGVPFVLADGGSWLDGTAESTLSKGGYLPALAARLPYGVAAVSEKDFLYGWPSLRGIIQKNNFPYLASNLRLDNKTPWPLQNYQIKTVNGVKIGFFAVLNAQKINAANRLTGITALDPVQTAQEMAALLKEKGVNAVVMFSSLGVGEGKRSLSDAQLAEEVPGIDLILSANLDAENPETDKINNTWIVYPGSKLDSVARIRLFFNKQKQLVGTEFKDELLDKAVYGEDAEIATQIMYLRADARQKMDARVTTVLKDINGDLDGESALGNLLSDCLHKFAKLDGVVLNSDSLRQNLPAGKLTEYDVYKMYPYNDNITFITIRGAAFKKALESSLMLKDNFPQVAGMTVEYNPSAPIGEKIKNITLAGGRILRAQDTYRFAVTDHIMAGGMGHDGFINALEFKNTFVQARQIMRACLVRQKEVDSPALNRWKKIK